MVSYVGFKNALGRNVVLPQVLCRSAQSFQNTLKIIVTNHPGNQSIRRGDYETITTETGEVQFRPNSNRSETLGGLLGLIMGGSSTCFQERNSQCTRSRGRCFRPVNSLKRAHPFPQTLSLHLAPNTTPTSVWCNRMSKSPF